MHIDRDTFLTLALSFGLAPQLGCGPRPAPAPPQRGTAPAQVEQTRARDAQDLPADECVQWDPTGECVGWAGDAQRPADECVQWDPTGECVGWAPRR